MKVREVILHTGPIFIIISFKLFLDLLRDLVFPRGLTDSQSHVPIFTNVDSWANSHVMIRVVRDLPSNKNGGGCWDKRVYTFSGRTWLVDYRVKRFQWLMFWNLYLGRNELCNRQDFAQNGKWKTIVDKYDLSDFNKRILGFLCGITMWWLKDIIYLKWEQASNNLSMGMIIICRKP